LRSNRSAVVKSTTAVRKSEGFELMSGKCSNCGKSVSELKRALEGSTVDAEKRRKKLEELKKLGFSGIVRG
jgi:hypothetical protein